MADRFIGCEIGSNEGTVMTEGSSSTAALDVEIRITTGAGGKIDVLQCLELIEQRIIAANWPLA